MSDQNGAALLPAVLEERRPESRALSVREVKDVAGILAASGFFADSKQMAQAAAKIMFGQELGFGPTASMTGVYFVKGRVSLSANLMAAAIKRSGRYDYRVRQHDAKGCVIVFRQRQDDGTWDEVGVSSFTEADAKAAGLSGGDNWRKYPRNMTFARAMSNGAKWYCPDVFAGHTPYLPDEIDVRVRATDEQGGYDVEDAQVVEAATDPAKLAEITALCGKTDTEPGYLAGLMGAPGVGALSDEQADRALAFLRTKAEDLDEDAEEASEK